MSFILKTIQVTLVIFIITGTINGHDDANNLLKISSGSITTIDSYPHQVQIRIGVNFCAGFIVNKAWVMTAAHCITTNVAASITVRAGSSTLDADGVVLTVTTIEKHAMFVPGNYDYNYALLKVSPDLTFTARIQAIALPKQGENLPIFGPISTAGWGYLGVGLTALSKDLQELKVKMIPQRLCNSIYQGKYNITDRMFCVGKLLITTKGACMGDGGSAAIYNKVAVGIMSFVDSCGSRLYPTVFAKISPVVVWVNGIIGT